MIAEEILKAVSNNKMIIAYMERQEIPSIDDLLDRRLIVREMFMEGLLNKDWVDAEIMAVDFLLWKHK